MYPEKVGVTGENLRGAVVGKDIDLRIDPRDAGHGKIFLLTKTTLFPMHCILSAIRTLSENVSFFYKSII